MHADQLEVTPEQVHALILDQLPTLGGEPVVPVAGSGTVNAIFRIGSLATGRFPLRAGDPGQIGDWLARESEAAADFGRASPFPTPQVLHLGLPGQGYPLPWSVQTWLDGETLTPTSHATSLPLAADLVTLISALREVDTQGRTFIGTGRGGTLTDHDDWVTECIRRSAGLIDTDAMRRLWADVRQLPREDPEAMCHTDLTPGNLLGQGDHLVGVLDAGGFQPADPALDLVCAWHLLDDGPREALRRDLDCPDLQWQRGRAWAFEQAAGLLWYYQGTNEPMAELGRATLTRLIDSA